MSHVHDTFYLDRSRFFAAVSHGNREIAMRNCIRCKRCCKLSTLSVGNVYNRYYMPAAKHFLYHSHEKAQEGAESSRHSITKDCFLNGGSFLSRENRERVG